MITNNPTLLIEIIRIIANTSTYARRRAEAMGWKFALAEITNNKDCFVISWIFTCASGEEKQWRQALTLYWLTSLNLLDLGNWLDVAAQLADNFSRNRLLADGYTAKQCDEFERLGREFDIQETKL